jgi:hypothetical protein
LLLGFCFVALVRDCVEQLAEIAATDICRFAFHHGRQRSSNSAFSMVRCPQSPFQASLGVFGDQPLDGEAQVIFVAGRFLFGDQIAALPSCRGQIVCSPSRRFEPDVLIAAQGMSSDALTFDPVGGRPCLAAVGRHAD